MRLLISASLLAGLAPLAAQNLPEGKGKELVADYCSACHGLDPVTSQRADRDGWETIVAYMVSRGMTATNEEVATMIDYLAKAFPQAPAPAKPKPEGKER